MKASSSEHSWAAHREDQAAFAEHSQVLMVSKAELLSGNSVQVQGFSEGTEGLSLSPDLGMVFFSCSWASNRGRYSHLHMAKPLA